MQLRAAGLAQPAPPISQQVKCEEIDGRKHDPPAATQASRHHLSVPWVWRHGNVRNEPHDAADTERFLSAGYGHASSASLQRSEPTRWDLPSADPKTNPDGAYMLALHTRLVDSGKTSVDAPVFTMGMSNGGGMANLFSLAARQNGLSAKGTAII